MIWFSAQGVELLLLPQALIRDKVLIRNMAIITQKL